MELGSPGWSEFPLQAIYVPLKLGDRESIDSSNAIRIVLPKKEKTHNICTFQTIEPFLFFIFRSKYREGYHIQR
jgi:hypothetical protein